ncbi:hypothetical protein scyTo_0016408 [Scyliorhinus torazame]|uniref:Uncharacterized protein n=1 Tax=Scyliorhinus torazame TaxID=75743 RepID=A0A401PQC6_SCYTO|nr:hypothetical protein [Scyliorhinus torazame]
MNSVDHIPQTLASHAGGHKMAHRELHAADMLKPDPRDTFFLTTPIDPSRVQHILPSCVYSPTYIVKDFPIARYQGLQFVSLWFIFSFFVPAQAKLNPVLQRLNLQIET